jgi:hypothetical protein
MRAAAPRTSRARIATHFPPDIEAVRQVLISVRVRQLAKTAAPRTAPRWRPGADAKGSSSRDRAEDTSLPMLAHANPPGRSGAFVIAKGRIGA